MRHRVWDLSNPTGDSSMRLEAAFDYLLDLSGIYPD